MTDRRVIRDEEGRVIVELGIIERVEADPDPVFDEADFEDDHEAALEEDAYLVAVKALRSAMHNHRTRSLYEFTWNTK